MCKIVLMLAYHHFPPVRSKAYFIPVKRISPVPRSGNSHKEPGIVSMHTSEAYVHAGLAVRHWLKVIDQKLYTADLLPVILHLSADAHGNGFVCY